MHGLNPSSKLDTLNCLIPSQRFLPNFWSLSPYHAEPSPDWVRPTFVTADGNTLDDILDCSTVGSGNQTFFEISTECRLNGPMVRTFARMGTRSAGRNSRPSPQTESDRMDYTINGGATVVNILSSVLFIFLIC
jgi:hypothetical protein